MKSLAAALAMFLLVACSRNSTFGFNDSVLVKYENMWWEAKIYKAKNDIYSVKYAQDQSIEEKVSLSRIAPMPGGKIQLQTGNTVVVTLAAGLYSEGIVNSLTDSDAVVSFPDGRTETVPLKNITKTAP